jgi:hypothetical protein
MCTSVFTKYSSRRPFHPCCHSQTGWVACTVYARTGFLLVVTHNTTCLCTQTLIKGKEGSRQKTRSAKYGVVRRSAVIVSPASFVLLLVLCVNVIPASTPVRYCWSRISPVVPRYGLMPSIWTIFQIFLIVRIKATIFKSKVFSM